MNNIASNQLYIPAIKEVEFFDYEGIVSYLRRHARQVAVDKINWRAYKSSPQVYLRLGFTETHLWLQFEVFGDHFRAHAHNDQEPVWEDACVEFFIASEEEYELADKPANEILYRNFEFNALGTCLSAYGNIQQREFLPKEEMNQILRFSSYSNQKRLEEGAIFDWELTVAIPLKVIGIHPGSNFRANFYKCGDRTLVPHFLSWSSIESVHPDFHLPQYFGKVKLEI